MSETEAMQIDNYTKFIMTVIAGALVVIALKGKGIIPTANAHSGSVHKIAICNANGKKCATVNKKRGSAVKTRDAIGLAIN